MATRTDALIAGIRACFLDALLRVGHAMIRGPEQAHLGASRAKMVPMQVRAGARGSERSPGPGRP